MHETNLSPDGQVNLYDLSMEELGALLARWGQPSYRVQQIWEWLYQHLVTEFSAMTNLPKTLRARLEEETVLLVPDVIARQEALDGETRKDLLELHDGERIEVVLMRYIERRTACISTQVGCAASCNFCATGQGGLRRDLSSGEIVTQVLHFERELREQGQTLTNVVLMGMGEPFFNYENTLAALFRLTHPEGFRMGQRRITLSTAGIAPAIRRFATEGLQVNLALSLHAATDELRDQLMPINRRYNLDQLFAAVEAYLAATNRQVTFEWLLIDNVNDSVEQAEALAARVAGMLAHVNLIPLNPTADFAGRPSSSANVEAFTQVLDQRHIPYTLRLRRGLDISAGCGQLRTQYEHTQI